MTQFEKRGVPTVSITAKGFIDDSLRSAENFGLPAAAIAVVAEPLTNQPPEAIHRMVEDALDEIIAGLTRQLEFERPVSHGITTVDEDWLSFDGEPLDAFASFNRAFIENGWGDGLPLIPPTESALNDMLRGTKRSRESVVAVLEPGFGIATVENIATNALMAGCRPEHLPVLIAAVECLAEPKMYLRNKAMSTGPHAPLLVINGPIADEIGVNKGVCVLGPGSVSEVNTVIGRALRLCMMNIGHAYPGVGDMDTIGSPAKYGMVLAEHDDTSPWDSYKTDLGFADTDSTVTVQFVYCMSDLYDPYSSDPERVVNVFATTAGNVGSLNTGLWLIGRRADTRYGTEEKEHNWILLGPDQAAIFARAGWTKRDLQERLYEASRVPFETLMMNKDPQSMAIAHPELAWLWGNPEAMIPVVEGPECFDIVVVGGTVARGTFMWGAGEPVTKRIDV